MNDSFIQVPPDGGGKKLDTTELTFGGNTVERQRVVLASPSSPTGLVDVGQAVMAASLPVAIASDQGAVPISISGSLPAGSAVLGAVTQSGTWASNLTEVGGAALALGQALRVDSLPVVLASDQGAVTVSGTVSVTALPTGGNTIGAVSQAGAAWAHNLTEVGGAAVGLGQALKASSLPVVLATDQGAVTVSGTVSVTALPPGGNNIGTVVLFDPPAQDNANNQLVSLADLSFALRNAMMLSTNRPQAVDPSTGNMRVTLNAITGGLTLAAVTTVSTVSAVTSLNQLNSVPIRDVQITPMERAAWGQNVRARIS